MIDLHAHYPMHVVPAARDRVDSIVRSPSARAHLLDRVRALAVHLVGRFANYASFESGPRVTVPRLHAGGVDVALSVLYSFWDELDWPRGANSPPDNRYFSRLIRQLELVEAELSERHGEEAAVARTPAELREALDAGKTVLVHCVEGAFHLGSDPERIALNVRELGQRGIAYITINHLFNRGVGECANAIPFLPDFAWRLIFPQPQQALLTPATATIRACVEERVLIDVCHMTEHAIDATLSLLDRLDPARTVPLLATHAGYRFGTQQYMICERHVRAIAARGGVIGLIMAQHQIHDGLSREHTHTFADSVDLLCRHIDKIHEVTGSHDHIGIGTDFDGFVKPTLSGLDTSSDVGRLAGALRERYGHEDAEKMLTGNALRVLTGYWRS